MVANSIFNYGRAFSRNIGWVTAAEQQKLKTARIAIAGLGGVGGAHLLTLCRLGVSNFSISDFDEFDVHNINRQAGAFMPFMGRSKLATMTQLALDINPELDVRQFPKGVQPDNLDEFLRDVDVYVDGLDFFALPARRMRDRLNLERPRVDKGTRKCRNLLAARRPTHAPTLRDGRRRGKRKTAVWEGLHIFCPTTAWPTSASPTLGATRRLNLPPNPNA